MRLIHEIGKEANRLEKLETGHIKRLDEVLEQYDDRRELWGQLRSIVEQWDRGEAADILGVSQRQVRNLLIGKHAPLVAVGPAGPSPAQRATGLPHGHLHVASSINLPSAPPERAKKAEGYSWRRPSLC